MYVGGITYGELEQQIRLAPQCPYISLVLLIWYMYELNTRGLKVGGAYALNRGCALNNGVRLTTRVYCILQQHWYSIIHMCNVILMRVMVNINEY